MRARRESVVKRASFVLGSCCAVALAQVLLTASPAHAQTTPQAAAQAVAQNAVACSSEAGQRVNCPADTKSGVALLRSTGSAPCLLGKTWGYDDTGIWVSDGCSGQFYAGQLQLPQTKVKPLEHVPNAGFLLYDGDQGQIYFRLFSYARYLNQRNLDATYVDGFGKTQTVQLRQDVQLLKFFAPFSGRSSATTCTSGPRTRRRATPRRSSAPATSATTSTATSRLVPASRRCLPRAAPKANFRTGSASTIG
jgi:hypothetical protein